MHRSSHWKITTQEGAAILRDHLGNKVYDSVFVKSAFKETITIPDTAKLLHYSVFDVVKNCAFGYIARRD